VPLTVGISLSSGGPATSSSRQLVVGEGGGGRGEEEDEGGSPFEVVDATTTMEVQLYSYQELKSSVTWHEGASDWCTQPLLNSGPQTLYMDTHF